MDAAPLFLLLLLPPADTTGDTAAGIQDSLRRELGEIAVALAPDTLVTPAMWRGEKAQLRARFVAKVEWASKHAARIELLASGPSESRQIRVLTFAPQDSRLERGRAIGLVLAELMRESPASAFVAPGSGASPPKAESSTTTRLAPAAMFAVERAMSGNWAMGPELRNGFGLSQAWCLQISGWAIFGRADKYSAVGFGLGARWDFLRLRDGRLALGLGLGVEPFHESATVHSDDHGSPSTWSLAVNGSLAGRVALWRWLRLVAEFDMRAVTNALSLTVGEDAGRRTYSYSHWRPGFSAGIEIAM
jgi:hypothetical protein